MDEPSNPLENPHLLALVGDDPLRLQELIAIVSHMWETAWAHGAFPDAPSGHSVIRPAPDPGLEEPLPSPVAPESVPSEPAPPSRSASRQAQRDRQRRWDMLVTVVGGDVQRAQELVELVVRLWRAASLRCPAAPT